MPHSRTQSPAALCRLVVSLTALIIVLPSAITEMYRVRLPGPAAQILLDLPMQTAVDASEGGLQVDDEVGGLCTGLQTFHRHCFCPLGALCALYLSTLQECQNLSGLLKQDSSTAPSESTLFDGN